MTIDERRLPRRVIVGGAGGLLALAACGDDSSGGSTTVSPHTSSSHTSGASAGAGGGATEPLARTADIPVGGGVILSDVVVTQPIAGSFVGLSAECTHQGCKVTEISHGTIDCRCHGSKFNLDGSVAHGPATRPLAARPVRVAGDAVVPA